MIPPDKPMRYPPATLLFDAFSGGGGLLVCLFVLGVSGLPTVIMVLALAGVALFSWFARQCWLRARLELRMDADGVTRSKPGLRIEWATLEGMSLRYFSIRRDRERGWFELGLTGPDGVLKVDSRITDFEDLLDAATKAAAKRELDLDPVTLGNLVDFQGNDGMQA